LHPRVRKPRTPSTERGGGGAKRSAEHRGIGGLGIKDGGQSGGGKREGRHKARGEKRRERRKKE
jgi:hypothetical protein